MNEYLPQTIFLMLLTLFTVYMICYLIGKIENKQERLKMVIQALIMVGTISTAVFLFFLQKLF